MTTPADVLKRLEARDATLWPQGNVADSRLGWLDAPTHLARMVKELRSWANAIERERVILLGMGGSSLAPEVLRSARHNTHLTVLDTTDPGVLGAVETEGAFFVVSSKSGTTLETRCLLEYFWAQVPEGTRWAAITDPGTELARLAAERGFNRCFEGPPDVGGRYSALTVFGMVPAALLTYDLSAVADATASVDRLGAVQLGLDLAEAARNEHRDKVTVVVPPGAFAGFGLWVEQLIAESTGKRGTGLVPVPTTEVEEGVDRFIEAVHLGDPAELGAEFLRWELAIAAAGHGLQVDPFDEPDVAAAKEATGRLLSSLPLPRVASESPRDTFTWLEDQVGVGDYVAVQAFGGWDPQSLEKVRRRIRDRFEGIAVTAGFGPRYLHSTGQLHKGGPPSVVAVQVVPSSPRPALPIPGKGYDFGTLVDAQAVGDFQTLTERGRRVLRVSTDDLAEVR